MIELHMYEVSAGWSDYWCVASNADEALALVEEVADFGDEVGVMVGEIKDDAPWTVTYPDDDPEPEHIPPGAVVTPRTEEKWPTVTVTAGEWAAFWGKPTITGCSDF